MKAVATALVLIASATVVLWYGNTLNSWVLGGLIGGLAALLLSIPISLTLFSYLSRRHDEKLRMEQQEEAYFAQTYEYPEIPTRIAQEEWEASVIDGYAMQEEGWSSDDWDAVEEEGYRPARSLPSPPYPPLPAPRRKHTSKKLTPRGSSALPSRHSSRKLLPAKQTTERRMGTSSRRTKSGYEPTFRDHHSAALRAARMETVQQFDDIEELSPQAPQRMSRSSRSLSDQSMMQQKRSRQGMDTSSAYDDVPHFFPEESERASQQKRHRADPETENLQNSYPQSDAWRPRTGPMSRRLQNDGRQRPHDTEHITGSLNKPLVRRAPYMYDDDPLRYELSQQLDLPPVRRSSLHNPRLQDDEEEAWG